MVLSSIRYRNMIEKLKFKKLLSEYKSLEYELQMVKEILKDGHLEFEAFYRQWCAVRDIDLDTLNRNNQKRVEKIFESNETGLAIKEEKVREDKHKGVYRSIAKKIHPDKLTSEDPMFWRDHMDFKDATTAMAEENWCKLFEIADRHDIYLKDYESICSDMEEDIERKKAQIAKEKSSYSWKLYECKDIPCKDRLIKSFLLQMFGWKE